MKQPSSLNMWTSSQAKGGLVIFDLYIVFSFFCTVDTRFVNFQRRLLETDYLFTKMLSGNSVSYTINLNSDKLFYMPYEVKIGVFNVHGAGPNSSSTVVYSSEGSEWFRKHRMIQLHVVSRKLYTILFHVDCIFYI